MFRFHTFRHVVCAALTIGAIAVAATAHAQKTLPLKGAGQGQVLDQRLPTPQLPGFQTYVGDGWISYAGQGEFNGSHDLTFDGGVKGMVQVDNADGSTLTGLYGGTWVPIDNTHVRFDVGIFWKGGGKIGRLAGVTGVAQVIAILNTETGVFEDTQEGEWTIPDKK